MSKQVTINEQYQVSFNREDKALYISRAGNPCVTYGHIPAKPIQLPDGFADIGEAKIMVSLSPKRGKEKEFKNWLTGNDPQPTQVAAFAAPTLGGAQAPNLGGATVDSKEQCLSANMAHLMESKAWQALNANERQAVKTWIDSVFAASEVNQAVETINAQFSVYGWKVRFKVS